MKNVYDLSLKTLCFKTKPDINGNTANVIIDTQNKIFIRDRYMSGPDYFVLSRKDFGELLNRLIWIGFKEV